MTPKQKLFVKEYLIDLNATQAAIRAGYSPKTARQQAEQLLTKPDIRQAIERAKAKRERKTELTAQWVVTRLMAEARFRGKGSSHNARVTALATLGKHLANFFAPQRHQHGGDANSPPIGVASANQHIDLSKLTDEELIAYEALLLKVTGVDRAETQSDEAPDASGECSGRIVQEEPGEILA